MDPDLTFLGATQTVTGSRFLLRVDGHQYLVDCGLFQGGRKTEAKNWEPFPFPPDRVDAVLLTHSHIDHVGYLPRLVANGFRGPVFATQATCALLELVLPDSARLQEQDAAYANKQGYSDHRPALPLYTTGDAEEVLRRLRPVAFDQAQSLDGVEVTWRPAGHMLGSASLEAAAGPASARRRVVFSGDLGRYDNEIMKPPTAIRDADVLLVESTYGDRLHTDGSIEDVLAGVLQCVIERKGVLLIPAFAVGRTQQVLYYIRKLQDAGRVPNIPVFIDSPMAVDASHIYCEYGDDHNLAVNLLMDEGACPLRCPETHFVREVSDSKALNNRPGPAVIISASGMLTGGRILHHLKWRLPDKRNAVLFVGYQAEGTRGRLLSSGAQHVRIHGENIPVRAQIEHLDALSGHADRSELLRWLGEFREPRPSTFIVHGEPGAGGALRAHLGEKLRWAARVPSPGESITLGRW